MARTIERSTAPNRAQMPRGDRGEGRLLSAVAVGVIVLLGTALRAYRIDFQSLWYDEGVSAAMAPRSILDITARAAADIHPPLYYYLLHFWSGFAGRSEFALRWLSLIAGVLLIAVVYAIGRRLFNPLVGLYAAYFSALSPFLIYYSQEARMYSQVALLASLSFLLFFRLVGQMTSWDAPAALRQRVILVAGYVLVSAAMLYSHYFAFTVLLAQNAAAAAVLLVSWGRRHGRSPRALRGGEAHQDTTAASGGHPAPSLAHGLTTWVAVQFCAVGLYFPWLLATLDHLRSWPSISEAFDLSTLVRNVFLVFTFGLSWDAAATPNGEAVFYSLLAGAFLFPFATYRRKFSGVALIVLYLAIPVLTMYTLSLSRPMYNPKFLLLAAPGYLVLLAMGLESLRQCGSSALGRWDWGWARHVRPAWSVGIAVLFLALVAYPSEKSLAAYYLNPKYARDDYRGLVEHIAAAGLPGDGIVLNAPGQEEIFRFYFRGDQPVYPLPRQRPLDETETIAELRTLLQTHPRIWLVLWATEESDPGDVVEHYLDENSLRRETDQFGRVRLTLYSAIASRSP